MTTSAVHQGPLVDRPRRERIVGVDVARCVALAGMMAIHILPAYDADGVTTSQSIAGGRASALFAVLAGVSLSLITGRRPVPPAEWRRQARGIVVRAGLIALIGLVLGELRTTVAVILTYYGLLFLLGIPFLLLGTRTLVAVAIGWALLAPVASYLLRPQLPHPSGLSPSFEQLSRPASLTLELLFTGYYPVFVWLTYLLVGLAVGRLSLGSWRTMARLGSVGLLLVATSYVVSGALVRAGRDELVAVAGGSAEMLEIELSGSLHGTTPTTSWWWLTIRTAHSGTTFDLMQTVGSAIVVLAACLAVGRIVPQVAAVGFGAGAMTLTLYTLHVFSRSDGAWDGETNGVYLGQLAVALGIGMAYSLLRRKGPLERFVGTASAAARGHVGGQG